MRWASTTSRPYTPASRTMGTARPGSRSMWQRQGRSAPSPWSPSWDFPCPSRWAAPHPPRATIPRRARAGRCRLRATRRPHRRQCPNPSSPIDRVGFVVIMAKIAATSPASPAIGRAGANSARSATHELSQHRPGCRQDGVVGCCGIEETSRGGTGRRPAPSWLSASPWSENAVGRRHRPGSGWHWRQPDRRACSASAPGSWRRLVVVGKEAEAISRRPDEAEVREARLGGFLEQAPGRAGITATAKAGEPSRRRRAGRRCGRHRRRRAPPRGPASRKRHPQARRAGAVPSRNQHRTARRRRRIRLGSAAPRYRTQAGPSRISTRPSLGNRPTGRGPVADGHDPDQEPTASTSPAAPATPGNDTAAPARDSVNQHAALTVPTSIDTAAPTGIPPSDPATEHPAGVTSRPASTDQPAGGAVDTAAAVPSIDSEVEEPSTPGKAAESDTGSATGSGDLNGREQPTRSRLGRAKPKPAMVCRILPVRAPRPDGSPLRSAQASTPGPCRSD